MSRFVAPFLFLLLLLPFAAAQDQVVINSKDWRDVYTGAIFASLLGIDSHYVAEESQGLMLIREVLNKGETSVLLVESASEPFVFGYTKKLEDAGFTVEEFVSTDPLETSIEFARRAAEEGIDSFIIVGDDLGYNAISVTPYAIVNRMMVIFADNDNIDDVTEFLTENARQVLVYGHIGRAVREALLPFNPDTINTGDRYKDNVEIVRRFLEKRPVKQLLLTNGEFIEHGFFNDEFPVLFIGTTNIPEHIVEFIQDQEIKTAIVIGYDLFENARRLRKLTGVRMFLKYGQGRNEKMYALDIFAIPSYAPVIELSAVRYNMLTKQLEVIYENLGDVYSYIQALSHELTVDGERIAIVGDTEASFIDGGDKIAITYDLDLLEYTDAMITAESKVAFGESPSSLTKLLHKDSVIEIVSVEDDSQIRIRKVIYNKKTKRFEIHIENPGKRAVYAGPTIVDLLVGDERVTQSGEQQRIPSGRTQVFKIKVLMEESDYEDNPMVTVRVRFGSREDALVNSLTEDHELVIMAFDYKKAAVVGMVVVIAMLLLLIRRRRRR